jgi:hypothetical protein
MVLLPELPDQIICDAAPETDPKTLPSSPRGDDGAVRRGSGPDEGLGIDVVLRTEFIDVTS